jgi:hypothetical protein
MDPIIEHGLAAFDPISLDALNAKAEMLTRLDNKYIVPGPRLQPAISAFAALFDVLEISGKRAFSYSTRYFDDVEKRGYYDHLQRRRKRCKVRVRDYLDAGFSYLEIKLKEKRSMTVKHRLSVANQLVALNGACMQFVDDRYHDCYDASFAKQLDPAMIVDYERITLVAKHGGERMTIDTGLTFRAPNFERRAPSYMFIVETKSARGNGIADKVMRSLHIQPTKHASKYCIGMAATGQVTRRNNFLTALRRLELADMPTLPPASTNPPSVEPLRTDAILRSNHHARPSLTRVAYSIGIPCPATAFG